MGMFDSVMVPCPRCGSETEAQSKSGACLLDEYTLDDAPGDVMLDVNRHAPFSCSCGCKFSVNAPKRRVEEEPASRLAVVSLVDASRAYERAYNDHALALHGLALQKNTIAEIVWQTRADEARARLTAARKALFDAIPRT